MSGNIDGEAIRGRIGHFPPWLMQVQRIRAAHPAPVDQSAIQLQPTLAFRFRQGWAVGARCTFLQERQALFPVPGRRVDLPGAPACGHFSQSVDMFVQRVAVICRNKDGRRLGIGVGNVARRAQHRTVACAIGVASIQHFHDRLLHPRQIGMGHGQARFLARVEPGEEPALLQHAVPEPGQVLAIGRRMPFRQVAFTEQRHLFRRPDGVSADCQRTQQMRVALEHRDQDDPAQMEAVGADRAGAQGFHELRQPIGEIRFAGKETWSPTAVPTLRDEGGKS